jgi:hypothetical protein
VVKNRIEPEIPAQDVSHSSLKKTIGKVIRDVEYGFDKPFHPSSHQAETIIFHFTDGTSLSIQIGSNATNVSSEHPSIKASDFRTDLIALFDDGKNPR